MRADERRKAILKALTDEGKVVSGSVLADRFEVSRQVIVGDISALKQQGHEIQSTHYGYLLHRSAMKERTFKILHTRDNTEDELSVIVGLGGTVVNVYVWHKVYGRLEAPLNISTTRDVERFMEGVRSGKSTELMNVTGGYHYHTIRAENEKTLDDIESALESRGYIAPEQQM